MLHWKLRGLTCVEVDKQIDNEGAERRFLYYHEEDEERIFEEETQALNDLANPHNLIRLDEANLPKFFLEPKIINAEQIFKSDECVICLINPPNVLFCNCSHLCICVECDKMKSLKDCPICKTESNIKRIIN